MYSVRCVIVFCVCGLSVISIVLCVNVYSVVMFRCCCVNGLVMLCDVQVDRLIDVVVNSVFRQVSRDGLCV